MRLLAAAMILCFPLALHATEGSKVIKQCWDNGGSHVEIVACEWAKKEEVRKDMERMVETLRAEAAVFDKNSRDIDSVFDDQEAALLSSQKAFETYMREECGRRIADTMGGTYGADAAAGCQIDLMRERIRTLSVSY